MALFGWESTKQVALYTKKARRAKLESAAAPLLLGRIENESVPPFQAVAPSGAKRSNKP
jgi:hypothetical protein